MRELKIEDMERLADTSDQATAIDMASTVEALDKHRLSLEPRPSDFDGIHCVDCMCEIPEERRKTGAWRDIDCQQIFERLKGLYRHG